MKEFDKVILEKVDNIGVMKFNDPNAMNAVSDEMLNGIWSCLNAIEDPASNIKSFFIRLTYR